MPNCQNHWLAYFANWDMTQFTLWNCPIEIEQMTKKSIHFRWLNSG